MERQVVHRFLEGPKLRSRKHTGTDHKVRCKGMVRSHGSAWLRITLRVAPYISLYGL